MTTEPQTQTEVVVTRLPLASVADCPICGSRPRRSKRRKDRAVVCFAGSHRLEVLADTQIEADRLWNEMAADWAKRMTREGQVTTALSVVEAIASIEHIANLRDGGLNTHAAQLRHCARVFRSALSTAGKLPEREEARAIAHAAVKAAQPTCAPLHYADLAIDALYRAAIGREG